MKIDKNSNRIRTNIPADIRDILNLKAGDTLQWIIENNMIKIEKEE